MLYVIILVALVFTFVFYFKFERFFTPVSIIFLIWCFLLALSNLSLTGLFVPSQIVQAIFILALISMSFGAIISTPCRAKSDVILANSGKLWILFVLIAAPPLITIIIYSFKIIFESGYYGFLMETRWGGASIDESYGSTGIFSYIFNVSRPIIYAFFFVSAALFFTNNERPGLFFSTLLMVGLAFILSARAEALTVIFVLTVGYLLNRSKRKKTSYIWPALAFTSLISFIYFVSIGRGGGKLNLVEIFYRYVIDYHTLGFTMFDQAFNNPDSLIHGTKSLDSAVLSGLGFFIKQIARVIGEDYVHAAGLLRSEMISEIAVGISSFTGEVKHSNAFYTVLYGVYSDLGVFGVFFIPALYGFFLMRHYLSFLKYGSTYSFVMVLFLTWTGYNSLFFPAVLSDYWWFVLLIIVLFGNVNLRLLRRP